LGVPSVSMNMKRACSVVVRGIPDLSGQLCVTSADSCGMTRGEGGRESACIRIPIRSTPDASRARSESFRRRSAPQQAGQRMRVERIRSRRRGPVRRLTEYARPGHDDVACAFRGHAAAAPIVEFPGRPDAVSPAAARDSCRIAGCNGSGRIGRNVTP
jgi:hypothetical protein